MTDILKQTMNKLSEARKIIRASSSRQLAKEWDRKVTALLDDIRETLANSQPAQATQAKVTDELLNPEDFNVEVVMKQTSGFDPVRTQGVRVTHKPTGISVTCDAARSQHTNRHQALEQLRAILALRPAAVPMTEAALTERARIVDLIEGRACLTSTPRRLTLELNQLAEVIKSGLGWLEYERYKHNGITAQAKKEGV